MDVIEKCEMEGEFVTLDDGFVYYWIDNKGAMSSDNLRVIADELDRRNAEWQKEIQTIFDNKISENCHES